jgi:membrane-anchored protein YejM (alkaline phosphatase superfamily)
MRKKDIKGYEGLYYVTDTGEVWSYDRIHFVTIRNKFGVIKGKKMKFSISNSGYPKIVLTKNKLTKTFTIHRLVAIAFCKNRKNKPDVNHIDGNKLNNNSSNLEWVTKSENTRHAIKLGSHRTVFVKGHKIKVSDTQSHHQASPKP